MLKLFLLLALLPNTELIRTDGAAGTTGPVITELAGQWTLSRNFPAYHNVLTPQIPERGPIRGFSVLKDGKYRRVVIWVWPHGAEATAVKVTVF